MNNTEEKLIKVFETTFSDLPADRIKSATQETTPNWDSVAAITLMNLIEEEFEIQMDFEDLGELTSFQKILVYVNGKLAQAAA
ncbi:MAG: acyl carrier protein [Acidobacteriaceae bacterium]|nr:acyl carrier protein [Acidobacteriaceae bacterium]MBV9034160.1 acyl carrier protein [Acidobacteriaceae bacterium]MBV9308367.1 acyl carrier protein [Acidobacteriaceae bacterium]MBV9675061.1 acyl carrier protein [Acidobacteriaceae bacterium]